MGLFDFFRPAPQTQPRPGEVQPGPVKGGILAWIRDKLGGWPGAAAAQNTPVEAELERERIHIGPHGIIQPHFLPWLDDRSGETLEHRREYRKMPADCSVKAALASKLWGVASLDLQIVPPSKSYQDGMIADFVRYAITERLQEGIPGLAWSILWNGLVDGYSVSEKIFQVDQQTEWGQRIVIDKLKPKMVDDDVILRTDEFGNVKDLQGMRYNAGLFFDPRNFVIFRHMPSYDNPTGMSDLRAAYRPYWLKNTAETLRGVAIEKRAIPVAVGHYETTSQKPTLDRAMALLKSQNFLTVPKGVLVDMLNIAGSADKIFDDACKHWQHEIFLAINGAMLQQIEGSVQDGRGNSKVHKSIADLFKWALSASLEWIINNQIIRDLVDLNFTTVRRPKALLSSVDVNELVQEMAIDTGLNKLVQLSKEKTLERYSRSGPMSPDDVIPVAPQPGGAAAAGPPSPLQQVQAQQRRDVSANSDTTPAAEVPGTAPFRYSEGWYNWLNGHATNGNGR